MTGELFPGEPGPAVVPLAERAMLLRGLATEEAPSILALIEAIAAVAPFRHLVTPGGLRMSVAMTNCGRMGWVSDRRGYRYEPIDRERGLPWPSMPVPFLAMAARAAAEAGFPGFTPDACLINRYAPGARLSLHQDRDERDLSQPIVSVSLGGRATFLFGGEERTQKPTRLRLRHGDVVVWGGPSRLAYHGIDTLRAGHHPLTGEARYKLTFRVTGLA
jgi:alkylated DNA repair protein (DNA oxidative demethylase)